MKLRTAIMLLIIGLILLPGPEPEYKFAEMEQVTLVESGKTALIVELEEGQYLVNYVDDHGAIRQKYVSEEEIREYHVRH